MLFSANTITIRFLSPHSRWSLVFFALSLLVIWLGQASPAASQDLNAMPWIDQESGELSPQGIKEREQAITQDRTAIPIVAPKKPKPVVNQAPAVNSGGLSALGPVMVYGLITIGVLLLIGLVVWVFMTSRIDIGSDTVSSRSDRSLAESIRHLPFEMDVKQGDFRQQAQAAYQAGDFRKALVFLFSHVLVTLDQAKLVRLKKGKTNRQYLRELSPSPSLVKYYGDVMVPFEQTFFGDYPVTKEIFEDCWQGLDNFQSSVDAAKARASRSSVKTPIAVGQNAIGTITSDGQGINV